MPELFSPLRLRALEIPNRLWMSPMCMYSADDAAEAGRPTDFHLAHYASHAFGGAGLVMVEATAVQARGRISPWDLGLWDDGQIPDFARLAAGIRHGGAVPAVQLAHAGRKASADSPARGGGALTAAQGGWPTVGPSPIPFPGYPVPEQMSVDDITELVDEFAAASRRAREAGFEVVEIHAAHGYLLHSFLSPVANRRTDRWGGDFAGRTRLLKEVVAAVRSTWPDTLPVMLRISSTDWIEEDPTRSEESWTVEDSIRLAAEVCDLGVDLVDVSSGGLVPARISRDRDYQTSKAARLRRESGVPVAGVGRISEPVVASGLVASGDVDAVFVARQLLREISWPNRVAQELGAAPRHIPQYSYAV
ncbi:MAG: NADH:flavin oxidoreductase/NADH oxidase [Nesterenkonia sp.]|nr:NADH:flavin oxidoreductase/NADH oxidase [Nesterenkonia sp.]